MKIKIVTPRNDHAEAWVAALSRAERAVDVNAIRQPLHTVNVLVNGSRPDLLVAEVVEPGDLDALETLANRHPEIDCILVGGELTPEVLLRMMRAGVREVLPLPVSADALVTAVQRLARKRAHVAAPAEIKHGQILSFVSCKGGSGATFIAANVAHILAADGQRRVALIDMNLQFGDAALFVTSERPASHVADVSRNIGRLDRDLLQSAMMQAAPGLWVLAAPDDPAHAAEVLPEHVQAILKLAREMFDFVVIDTGRSLSAVSLQALDMSDRVFAVLQLNLPFIRDGKRLRDVFRSLDYPARKIHWVVNRYQKDSEITLDDLKKTLGITEVVVLPNQYQVVAASVNQGATVDRIAPGSPIAKALRELSAMVAPSLDKARSGWLSGLIRSSGKTKGSEAT